MNEREPRQSEESIEQPQSLEVEEANDLATLWQAVGSGIETEFPTDPEATKKKMWEDTERAYFERVIPNLEHFKLATDLEEKIATATNPSEKSQLERELADSYQSQLKQEKSGWGTTPALSEQTDFSLDCLGASAVMTLALRRAGVEANPGTVWGHKIVIMTDAENKKWYYDPRNGNKGEITAAGEQRFDGVLYELSEEEAAQIDIPYKRVVELPPQDGFLSSMIGNIAVLSDNEYESHTKPKHEIERIYENNRETLHLRNWLELGDKLLPNNKKWEEWISLDQQYVEEQAQLHEQTQAVVDRITDKVTSGQVSTEEERQVLSRQIFAEALAQKDAVWAYIQGTDNELPPFSESTTALFTSLREELNQADEKVREVLLARFSRWLHPKQ
jgi:hypothetical protein